MSHFTRVKTKITDKEMLIRGLNRMGIKVQEGSFKITQDGTTESCELKVDNSTGFALQKDGTWAMVGDPYYSQNAKMKSFYRKEALFNQELTVAYSVEKAKYKLEAHDFYCAETTEDDETITMVFRSDY